MTQTRRYSIVEGLRFVKENFGLEPMRSILQAGLPVDFMGAGERPVSAEEYYDIFHYLERENISADFVIRMAQQVVEQGFDSSVYSFYSSPNVRVGLQRKSLLKPLLMPIRMTVTDYDQHLAVSFAGQLEDRPLPRMIGWFNLCYFIMAIRHATGVHVVPAAVQAGEELSTKAADDMFGTAVTYGSGYRLILKSEDADLPLITRNDSHWEVVESGLQERFLKALEPQSTAARVRQALVDGMPGGQVTADQIARSLALSKRSLQRRLSEEGLSFKDVLEDTRRALSLNYLLNTQMSMQEIAYLLGFRDPSSFFRAFRGWTGRTPQSIRAEAA